MSEFVECETKLKDEKALIEGLIAMGFTKEHIEVHKEATHLYGYRGDKRQQLANIIIRRQHVGGASNDMGFLKKADGTFEAIVSAYDRSAGVGAARTTGGYNEKWLKQLYGNYNEKLLTRKMKEKGMEVRRVVKDKRVILVGYK